jgi:branched-chain amino acid transport system substrate-binding protein
MKMKRLIAATLALIVLSGCSLGSKQKNDPAGVNAGPIKIGAIFPVTGTTAAIGEEEKRGLAMALDQLKGRTVAGRSIEVIVEDDKSEPTAAISAAQKLLSKDQVFALTGGYSSTTAAALLNSVKAKKPLTLFAGAGSVKVEEGFGQEEWFFHLHPWDYDYQTTVVDFLANMNPKAATVALAYEDQLYGTSHATVFRDLIKKTDLKLVMDTPFKSGANDLTPLLTKVKSLNPDIFYWVGYVGDSILITKQAKELGLNVKMMMDTVGVGTPDFQTGVGKSTESIVGVEPWGPYALYPASTNYAKDFPSTADWVKTYKARYNREPDYWSVIVYVNILSLVEAMERAGTVDQAAVAAELKKTNTMTPMGPLEFKPSQKAKYQGFSRMVMFQWQKDSKVAMWPADVAGGKLVYPRLPWDK